MNSPHNCLAEAGCLRKDATLIELTLNWLRPLYTDSRSVTGGSSGLRAAAVHNREKICE